MSLPPPRRGFGASRGWGPTIAFAAFGTAGLVVALTEDLDVLGHALYVYGIGLSFWPHRKPGVTSRDYALVLPVSRPRVWAPLAAIAAYFVATGIQTDVSWAYLLLLYVLLAAAVVRRGVSGELRLFPAGIALPSGRRVAWADDVRVSLFGWYRVGDTRLSLPPLVADGTLLYWTLRFYAAHPEAREELADERALDRVLRAEDEPALLTGTPREAVPAS